MSIVITSWVSGYCDYGTHADYVKVLSTDDLLRAKVPIDFMLDHTRDERTCAKRHLKLLSPADLVVYDRGFQSFNLFHDHVRTGIQMVLRIDCETTFNAVKDFAKSTSKDKVVEFSPAEGSLGKIRRTCPEAEFTTVRIRLIKYSIKKKTYILATTLLDRKLYPRKIFPALYHSRWGVEEMYKTLKSSLGAVEFHGKSRRKVEQEIFAGFLMITIARLFANSAENDESSDGISLKKRSMQINFKSTIQCLGAYIDSIFILPSKGPFKLIQSLLKMIARLYQKIRPGRSYPRVSRKPRNKWLQRPSRDPVLQRNRSRIRRSKPSHA